MDHVEFSYRLPVTWIRVTGTRTEISDLDGHRTQHQATVTTELAADFRTRCPVSLSAGQLATQKATWALTSDGRLTGADVTTTVEPMAVWAAVLQAGGVAASIALPALLLAGGPPGWAALGGAVAVGALSARALTVHMLTVDRVDVDGERDPERVPAPPKDAIPRNWGIADAYVQTHEAEALELANLRSCLAEGGQAHAKAVRAAALVTDAGDQQYWADRIVFLRSVLASASVGAARAETAYATWAASQTHLTTTNHDYRFPIDLMPTRESLLQWARGEGSGSGAWIDLVSELRVAVSVDIGDYTDAIGDRDWARDLTFEPTTNSAQVHYRPPRPVVLRVWDVVTKEAGRPTRYQLNLRETQWLQVAHPGNETTIAIETGLDSTNAVAVTFDDLGALTKVATELKDPTLQRASDAAAVLKGVHDGVAMGKDLRDALAPPSLVDRAAEAKAAAELGLVPAAEDPLKELKAQLQEQQLRAQLKLAEQIQAASSMPIFVTVDT